MPNHLPIAHQGAQEVLTIWDHARLCVKTCMDQRCLIDEYEVEVQRSSNRYPPAQRPNYGLTIGAYVPNGDQRRGSNASNSSSVNGNQNGNQWFSGWSTPRDRPYTGGATTAGEIAILRKDRNDVVVMDETQGNQHRNKYTKYSELYRNELNNGGNGNGGARGSTGLNVGYSHPNPNLRGRSGSNDNFISDAIQKWSPRFLAKWATGQDVESALGGGRPNRPANGGLTSNNAGSGSSPTGPKSLANKVKGKMKNSHRSSREQGTSV